MQFPAIDASSKANFETLVNAIKDERVCLMSAFDQAQAVPVFLLCAVNECDPEELEFVPLATLCKGNPYERFLPPLEPEKSLPSPRDCGTLGTSPL